MKRITLIFSVLAAALVTQFVPGLRQSQVVYAQCTSTVHGKNISANGTLVCDCTQSANTNCDCVVSTKCPGSEEEFYEN
jgi:hypothetical protein